MAGGPAEPSVEREASPCAQQHILVQGAAETQFFLEIDGFKRSGVKDGNIVAQPGKKVNAALDHFAEDWCRKITQVPHDQVSWFCDGKHVVRGGLIGSGETGESEIDKSLAR